MHDIFVALGVVAVNSHFRCLPQTVLLLFKGDPGQGIRHTEPAAAAHVRAYRYNRLVRRVGLVRVAGLGDEDVTGLAESRDSRPRVLPVLTVDWSELGAQKVVDPHRGFLVVGGEDHARW